MKLRQHTKRLIALLVALAMVLGTSLSPLAGTVSTVSAAEEDDTDTATPTDAMAEIKAGDKLEAYISDGETLYYSITVSQSGVYMFYTEGDEDTEASLYDGDDNFLYYDDQSGENDNFQICYYLEEGSTYYLTINLYYGGSGSFNVCMDEITPYTSEDVYKSIDFKNISVAYDEYSYNATVSIPILNDSEDIFDMYEDWSVYLDNIGQVYMSVDRENKTLYFEIDKSYLYDFEAGTISISEMRYYISFDDSWHYISKVKWSSTTGDLYVDTSMDITIPVKAYETKELTIGTPAELPYYDYICYTCTVAEGTTFYMLGEGSVKVYEDGELISDFYESGDSYYYEPSEDGSNTLKFVCTSSNYDSTLCSVAGAVTIDVTDVSIDSKPTLIRNSKTVTVTFDKEITSAKLTVIDPNNDAVDVKGSVDGKTATFSIDADSIGAWALLSVYVINSDGIGITVSLEDLDKTYEVYGISDYLGYILEGGTTSFQLDSYSLSDGELTVPYGMTLTVGELCMDDSKNGITVNGTLYVEYMDLTSCEDDDFIIGDNGLMYLTGTYYILDSALESFMTYYENEKIVVTEEGTIIYGYDSEGAACCYVYQEDDWVTFGGDEITVDKMTVLTLDEAGTCDNMILTYGDANYKYTNLGWYIFTATEDEQYVIKLDGLRDGYTVVVYTYDEEEGLEYYDENPEIIELEEGDVIAIAVYTNVETAVTVSIYELYGDAEILELGGSVECFLPDFFSCVVIKINVDESGWYKIYTEESETAEMTGEIYLEILDKNADCIRQVWYENDSLNGSTEIYLNANTPYYVLAWNYYYDTADNTYKVCLDVADSPYDSATALILDDLVTVTDGADDEYFTVCVDTTGKYIIYSTTDLDNDDPCATLYDENFNQIIYDDDSDGYNFQIKCNLEAGVTYYLHVEFFNHEGEVSIGLIEAPIETEDIVSSIDFESATITKEVKDGAVVATVTIPVTSGFDWKTTTIYSTAAGLVGSSDNDYTSYGQYDKTQNALVYTFAIATTSEEGVTGKTDFTLDYLNFFLYVNDETKFIEVWFTDNSEYEWYGDDCAQVYLAEDIAFSVEMIGTLVLEADKEFSMEEGIYYYVSFTPEEDGNYTLEYTANNDDVISMDTWWYYDDESEDEKDYQWDDLDANVTYYNCFTSNSSQTYKVVMAQSQDIEITGFEVTDAVPATGVYSTAEITLSLEVPYGYAYVEAAFGDGDNSLLLYTTVYEDVNGTITLQGAAEECGTYTLTYIYIYDGANYYHISPDDDDENGLIATGAIEGVPSITVTTDMVTYIASLTDGAEVTIGTIYLEEGDSLTIPAGVTVNADSVLAYEGSTLIVEGTLNASTQFYIDGAVNENSNITGTVTSDYICILNDDVVGDTATFIGNYVIMSSETLQYAQGDEVNAIGAEYDTTTFYYWNGSSWQSDYYCDHTYGDGVVTVEATCTEDGLMTYTCTECYRTTTQVIEAAGHSYNSGVVTVAATITSEGVITYTCTVCGETKTETIDKLTATAKDDSNSDSTSNASTTTEATTETATDSTTETTTEATATAAAEGTILTASNGATYKVTKSGSTPTVAYTAPKNKKVKSVTIPETVTIDGVTYKVTSIAAKAFKGCKSLKKVTIGSNITSIGKSAFAGCTKMTKVTIGKNVKTIGANAFKGCKKLKTITIKSTVLKKVGKNAIKGINAKAKIKVPKAKLKAYKKLFKSKTGFKSTMKIKK